MQIGLIEFIFKCQLLIETMSIVLPVINPTSNADIPIRLRGELNERIR